MQADTRLCSDLLEQTGLVGHCRVFPHSPDAADHVSAHIASLLKPDRRGSDHVEKFLVQQLLFLFTAAAPVRQPFLLFLFLPRKCQPGHRMFNGFAIQPPLPVKIIIVLGDDTLGKIDGQQPFHILPVCSAHVKAMLLHQLGQTVQIRIHLLLIVVFQTDTNQKFPCGCGLDLNLIQIRPVLFHKGAQDRQRFLPDPPFQVFPVGLKVFSGIQRHPLHFLHGLRGQHQLLYLLADRRFRENRQIGGPDQIIDQRGPLIGFQAKPVDGFAVDQSSCIFLSGQRTHPPFINPVPGSYAFPFSFPQKHSVRKDFK